MLFLPEEALAPNVFCFTTSVQGGVSDGAYKSFNLGMHVQDNLHRVATNRQLLHAIITQQAFNRSTSAKQPIIAPIQWLNQQHSNVVFDYDSAIASTNNAVCDAIYTTRINTPLAVMTADCLPIIIACTKSGQIAAIHAGWRGLLNGILNDTVTKFSDKSSLAAWIGPSISPAHFHISDDIITQFSNYKNAILPATTLGKYHVDLAQIAHRQLADLTVPTIQKSPICTYSSEYCFSHRRASHHGFQQTGRMATVVLRV
jgi:YfiH family protein